MQIPIPNSLATEQDLIRWLGTLPRPDPRVWPQGIGDDAAILLPDPGEDLVVSTDMLLDGACFLLDQAGAKRVGRKSLAVNLSDLAAMAARPLGCFLSLALPKGGDCLLARELISGLTEMGEEFDCPLIGGDTNSWPGPLAISVTVIGAVQKGRAILRSGARPGDWLMVTGLLGGSILGHHLDFKPRVQEARKLAESFEIHAMMDISDGLAKDTRTLCTASGCGAVLVTELLPLSPESHQLESISALGIQGKTPEEHALGDGEDYELLFTVSPEVGKSLLQEQPLGAVLISQIGECVSQGFWLEAKGTRSPLPETGWQHYWG